MTLPIRPRSIDPRAIGAEVHVRLRAPVYDALYAVATADGVTVPAIVRRAVSDYLRARSGPPTAPRASSPRPRVTVRRPLGV